MGQPLRKVTHWTFRLLSIAWISTAILTLPADAQEHDQGGQQRPFIRSITHAPGQARSQPQLLHYAFDLAASGCFPLCLGSERFS